MIDFVHLILQNEKRAKYYTLSNGYYADEEYTRSATEGRLYNEISRFVCECPKSLNKFR